MIEELKKLRKYLRREATLCHKKIGRDLTHLEGVYKGEYLAYEPSARKLDHLITKLEKQP